MTTLTEKLAELARPREVDQNMERSMCGSPEQQLKDKLEDLSALREARYQHGIEVDHGAFARAAHALVPELVREFDALCTQVDVLQMEARADEGWARMACSIVQNNKTTAELIAERDALRAENERLRAAAEAVVDDWDVDAEDYTPNVERLRAALENV